MTKAVRVALLDNEIEANLLSSLLQDEGINHLICTYRDSAYDGLFQTERGWGHVEASQEDSARVLEVIEGMRSSRDDIST